jgi:hypothetical protein
MLYGRWLSFRTILRAGNPSRKADAFCAPEGFGALFSTLGRARPQCPRVLRLGTSALIPLRGRFLEGLRDYRRRCVGRWLALQFAVRKHQDLALHHGRRTKLLL